MNKLNNNTKYEGFSLVEMIITLGIIGFVMLISSSALTTLIKTSTVSSSKTMVRNETEFILELVRRNIRNSNPADVYVYNSQDIRTYDPAQNLIVEDGLTDLESFYSTSLGTNIKGNEIHFRPYGYDRWVCIGFFPASGEGYDGEEEEFGYILKTTAENLQGNHQSCFDSSDPERDSDFFRYTILLNSDEVDIDSFDITYVDSADDNYLFKFDIIAKPVNWYFSVDAPVNREVYRQAVVTTGGLIW